MNALTPPARLLWLACPLMAFAVMFGHMNGPVNIGLAFTGFAVLAAAWAERRELTRWPLVVPAGLWAAWSLGAVAWSAYPALSWHAWLDEVCYPLIVFWGAWLFATRTGRAAWAAYACWLACALLALISALYWGQLQPPTPVTFPLRFYARVGHTSTLALFAAALFIGLMPRGRSRIAAVIGVMFCLFIGLASLNRFFWPAAAVTFFIAAFPLYRRRPRVAIAVLVALLAVGALLAVYGGMLRFGAAEPVAMVAPQHAPQPAALPAAQTASQPELAMPQSFVAFDDAVRADTRPKLWAFYAHEALRRAWIGIGFGKPLPGIALRRDMPPALIALEPAAPTHAHNLFLNTWLQTGLIGVIVQSALLVSLAWRFFRLRDADEWVAAAGVALVVGMLTKNFTDDFMWKATMLAFWAFAGLLLGTGERAAHAAPWGAVRAYRR